MRSPIHRPEIEGIKGGTNTNWADFPQCSWPTAVTAATTHPKTAPRAAAPALQVTSDDEMNRYTRYARPISCQGACARIIQGQREGVGRSRVKAAHHSPAVRGRFVVVQLHLGPGADRHGFDARPLGQGPGSRLGIGHHSWPQPTRPPLRRLKATAQRHVGPEGRLVYTSAGRDGRNGNSGWNVLTGGSHVVQESAPSRTQMSTTHAWRFRRLRARVSLVIPW